MKKFCLLALILISIFNIAPGQGKKTALIIIDIQDFYFPGGKSALVDPEKAAANAALLLSRFREEKMPVIHVRHNAESKAEINKIVNPIPQEKIVSKDAVNCFVGTDLLDYLKSQQIEDLVICGMQTHMCVEAATRAATDFGFRCVVISDACATKDLKFNDIIIKSQDVHYSTLSTLKSYAAVESTKDYLGRPGAK
jgi:nicotinamidase-related amidase